MAKIAFGCVEWVGMKTASVRIANSPCSFIFTPIDDSLQTADLTERYAEGTQVVFLERSRRRGAASVAPVAELRRGRARVEFLRQREGFGRSHDGEPLYFSIARFADFMPPDCDDLRRLLRTNDKFFFAAVPQAQTSNLRVIDMAPVDGPPECYGAAPPPTNYARAAALLDAPTSPRVLLEDGLHSPSHESSDCFSDDLCFGADESASPAAAAAAAAAADTTDESDLEQQLERELELLNAAPPISSDTADGAPAQWSAAVRERLRGREDSATQTRPLFEADVAALFPLAVAEMRQLVLAEGLVDSVNRRFPPLGRLLFHP